MEKKLFNIVLQGSELTSEAYIAAQFGNVTVFDQISPRTDKLSIMSIRPEKKAPKDKLRLIFYHKNLCSRREEKIYKFIKTFYTFIQLDKPTYKPGDDIKYRIVTLDNYLKPYDPNQIKITLSSPKGVSTANQDSKIGPDGKISPGVTDNYFKLDSVAEEGNWSISAIIDNNPKFNVSKTFVVQKYVLPLFEVKVTTLKKILKSDDKISVNVEARYSFGEFVVGNATVSIYDVLETDKPRDKWLFLQKGESITKTVETSENFEFTLKKDLKINTLRSNPHMLQIRVEFKDKLGSLKKTSEEIYVYNQAGCKISVLNLKPYEKYRPITFDVLIENFRGALMIDPVTPLEVSTKNSEDGILVANLKNGLASFEFKGFTNEDPPIFHIKFGDRCSNSFQMKQNSTSRYEDLIITHNPVK